MAPHDRVTTHAIWRRLLLALLSAPLIACAPLCFAQPAGNAPEKVFVETFPGNADAARLHDQVLARLHASHEVTVVDSAAQADLIVHGEGAIWLKGYLKINPHDAGARQPVYGGYLALELENRNGEKLWSYLVVPGRMRWNGAAADMADHIVRLMLTELKHPHTESVPALSRQNQVALAGAGSTFAAPLYQDWIESYAEHHPEVHTSYQAVGSEAGLKQFEDRKADFAASDVALTDRQLAAGPVKAEQFATVLGGVVPAYNLPGVTRDVQFTPQILARIYLGKITRWNDPQLLAVNHGAGLPDAPIIVLHRSDGSGTTFAWTQFLAATNEEWKSAVGSGMRVNWPAGEGLAGNDAIALRVAATPGAIGYVELTYAIRHQLSYGMVRNAAGHFVQANLNTLSEAVSAETRGGGLRGSLVNAPGKEAYPIATFTWLVLPASSTNAEKLAALHDLVRWMLTDGQRDCSALGYVPLPRNLAEKELAQVPTATAQLEIGPPAK